MFVIFSKLTALSLLWLWCSCAYNAMQGNDVNPRNLSITMGPLLFSAVGWILSA